MYGYIIKPKDLNIRMGRNASAPLTLSATAFDSKGHPLGLVAVDGMVYRTMPEDLPMLIKHGDGSIDIRKNASVDIIADACFVVSGTSMLVEEYKEVEIKENGLNLIPNKVVWRSGVGTTQDGNVLHVTQECTLDELQLFFSHMGCREAMQVSCRDVYLKDVIGGIKLMGTTMPITVLEASTFRSLTRPIVVIDAGHGGRDPGAVGSQGLQEKNINLSVANGIYLELTGKYQGTFLMTRIYDTSMTLDERTSLINGIGADLVVSVHSNGHSDIRAHGYETFVHPDASEVTRNIQKAIHSTVMRGLATLGRRDRGMKTGNYHMTRVPRCPSILVENLFVSNPAEAEMLRDEDFIRSLSKVTAEGIANALELERLKPQSVGVVERETRKLFRVQVGAYAVRQNAEAMEERLKNAGFPAFIVREP